MFLFSIAALTSFAKEPANLLFNADCSVLNGYGHPLGWEVLIGDATNLSTKALGDGVFEICWRGKRSVYLSQTPLTLKSAGKYRARAEVKISDTRGAHLSMWIWNWAWQATNKSKAFPRTTNGGWQTVEWTGEVVKTTHPAAYTFALVCSGVPDGGELRIQIRNLSLTALDEESAAESSTIPQCLQKQPPMRIVPINPKLAQYPAAGGDMTFYWMGRPPCGRQGCELVVGVDRKRMGEVKLGGDGRAKFNLGPLSLGEHELALAVREIATKKVLAKNSYRLVAVKPPPVGCEGKRLNNFVTQLLNIPLKDGEYTFFRREPGWVWISFGTVDGAGQTARGYLDGRAVAFVRPRDGEPLLETMRYVSAGRHSLTVKGVTGKNETLRIHAVKQLVHPGWLTTQKECRFTYAYVYSFDFGRRFLINSFNTLSGNWKAVPMLRRQYDKAYWEERGYRFAAHKTLGAIDERRFDEEAIYRHYADFDLWQKGENLEIDENAIGAAFMSHVNFAEAAWRLQADRPKQRMFVDWCDVMSGGFWTEPIVSEIAAIVNSGNGTGLLVPETYSPALSTPEASDKFVNCFIRFIRNTEERVPASKGSVLLYMASYIGIADWCQYASPEADLKAHYNRLYRRFACDPEFANCAGTSAAGDLRGDEETQRWMARCVRHYAVEGRSDDLAQIYGFKWNPGFVQNCDFEQGLSGWTAKPAAGGGIAPEKIAGYGKKVQVRVLCPDGLGDNVAVFTASDSGENVLEQKLTGLEPGRYYSLMFVVASENVARRTSKDKVPCCFSAQISGAQEVRELRFRQRKDRSRGFPVHHRYVFKALSPAATLRFLDRLEDGSKLPTGMKQMLNYVIFRKYYVESEKDISDLIEITRGAAIEK
jgi:hypothetical protein